MQAIILAAGDGSRMNYPDGPPKVMLNIHSQTLLEYHLNALSLLGVTSFVVVAGYRGEIVEQFIADRGLAQQFNLCVIRNDRWREGNASSILAARPCVKDGRFVVVMGDHLFDPDGLHGFLKVRGDFVGLFDSATRYVDVAEATKAMSHRGHITALGKELTEFKYVDTGMFICSQRIFPFIEECLADGIGTFNEVKRRWIATGNILHIFDYRGVFWMDVDTKEELESARHEWPRHFPTSKSQSEDLTAVIVATETHDSKVSALIRLCGLPLLKRTLFTLRAIGVRNVVVIGGEHIDAIREAIGDGNDLGLHVRYSGVESVALIPILSARRFLVLEGNYVWDERILRALCERHHWTMAIDSEALLDDQVIGVPVSGGRIRKFGSGESTVAYVGAAICEREALPFLMGAQWSERLAEIAQEREVRAFDVVRLESYHPGVRRSLKPYWFRIRSDADVRRAKMQLIESAQKGTLDWWAWYVNRPLENWLMRLVADWPITPNQVSLLTNVAAYSVTLLWATGHLWPWALLAVVVSVLDGLDGKLARVKGLTSKLGTIEHSFDVLWEQAWYVALAWAGYTMGGGTVALLLGFIFLLLDTFNRHLSMQFGQTTGGSLAEYSAFDRRIRRIDGRRNTYLPYILIGAALGMPLLSLIAMTIHGGLTAIAYSVRASMHLRALDTDQETSSTFSQGE